MKPIKKLTIFILGLMIIYANVSMVTECQEPDTKIDVDDHQYTAYTDPPEPIIITTGGS